MTPPRHLFILSNETISAMGADDIAATVEGLKTLNLYHLPYDRVSVRMPSDSTVVLRHIPAIEDQRQSFYRIDKEGKIRPNLGTGHWVQFDNVNLLGEPVVVRAVCDGCKGWNPYNIVISHESFYAHAYTEELCNGLISLLATKNAVKTTTHNKLAKLGIGTRKGTLARFEYVTTISVPTEMEPDPDHPSDGHTVCPHLRRGHIRNQRYGPSLQYARMVWIAPIFVNADPTFVSKRRAYNIGALR